MRALKILAALLLLTACGLGQSSTGGPLQINGTLLMGAQFDPYCPGSGVQADRATRVQLQITNPTKNKISVSQLLGSFYDGNGQSLFTDRQATEIEPGQTETVYLYYNNTARVLVSSVLVTASYESGGKTFQNQVAVTPAGNER